MLNNETENTEKETKPKEKLINKINIKFVLIGMVAFIVQLVLVYFITANLLINKENSIQGTEIKSKALISHQKKFENLIYKLDDIIVNPAKTNGNKLLLISLAFYLRNQKEKDEISREEIQIKDAIITYLSSKTVKELSEENKELIKNSIKEKILNLTNNIQLDNIYITKYIIQ